MASTYIRKKVVLNNSGDNKHLWLLLFQLHLSLLFRSCLTHKKCSNKPFVSSVYSDVNHNLHKLFPVHPVKCLLIIYKTHKYILIQLDAPFCQVPHNSNSFSCAFSKTKFKLIFSQKTLCLLYFFQNS